MSKTKIQTLKGLPRRLQPLRGFRDFLPQEARKRAWLKDRMIEVFEKWGFEPLETPTLEPLELFSGEIGEDEKLFYKFKDQGGRSVALRYDQTVPTCRVVGQYFDKITFPFKRYQIQSAYRAEKPQKGRFREFVQADIDIFGVDSPIADAECISASIALYQTLGFKNVVALINNRDLLRGIPYPVIAAIDKLKKIGRDGVLNEIQQKGYSRKQAKEFLKTTAGIQPDKKLETIFDYLARSGFSKENYKFEPSLMRSFSYSQGPIWEMIIPEYTTASFGGSVGGGERYDDMVKRITGRKIAGTGIAFGFDRTLEAIEVCNLLPNLEPSAKVLITVFEEKLLDMSIKVAQKLRDENINTEIYLNESEKLEKQLKYADKKSIPFVVIIGPEEAAKGVVKLKDMKARTEKLLSIDELITVFNN